MRNQLISKSEDELIPRIRETLEYIETIKDMIDMSYFSPTIRDNTPKVIVVKIVTKSFPVVSQAVM